MCGLGEKMKNKPNEERISRKAASLQWTGNNTQAVMARLAQHGIIGELYRDIYIQVYKDGSYSDTLNIGDWLVEGEDGKLRLYTDETHALMYRPISDELERLRAFARHQPTRLPTSRWQKIATSIRFARQIKQYRPTKPVSMGFFISAASVAQQPSRPPVTPEQSLHPPLPEAFPVPAPRRGYPDAG